MSCEKSNYAGKMLLKLAFVSSILLLSTGLSEDIVDDGWITDFLNLFENSVVIKGEIISPVEKRIDIYEEYHDNTRDVHVVSLKGSTQLMFQLNAQRETKYVTTVNGSNCQATKASDFSSPYVDFDVSTSQLGLRVFLKQLQKSQFREGKNVTLYRGVSCVTKTTEYQSQTIVFTVTVDPYDPTKTLEGKLNNFVMKIDFIKNNVLVKVIEISAIKWNPVMMQYIDNLRIPAGLKCSGFAPQIVPIIQHASSFVLEVEKSKAVQYEKRFYDLDGYFTKIVSASGSELIIDATFGWNYYINNNECNIEKSPEAETNTNEWKDPYFVNGLLVYFTGQDYSRGVLCDVYEGFMTDPDDLKRLGLKNNATLQYYYASASVTDEEKGDSNMPVSLKIMEETTDSAPGIYTYNFYDFYQNADEDYSFVENFDIRNCIVDKAYSQIMFSSDQEFPTENFKDLYEKRLKTAIANLLSTQLGYIKKNRFPSINVEVVENQMLLVTVLMLDRTQRVLRMKAGDKEDISLKTAQEMLANQTKDSKLMFNFRIENATYEFLAVDYQPNLEPFDPRSDGSPFTLTVLETKYRAEAVENERLGDDITSLGACYRACKNNDTVGCVGFSFCSRTASDPVSCIISTELITENDSKSEEKMNLTISDVLNCNIYALNFLKMFNKDEGEVKVEKTSDAIESVISAEDCAIKCRSNEGDLFCRGFDYCAESKVCMLFDQHHDHSKETVSNNSLTCQHYALKYKSDYELIGKAQFVDSNAIFVEDISEADCAKQCSEYDGDGCNAYSFCPDGGKCALTKVEMSDLTSDKVKPSKECDLYLRSGLVDEIIKPKNRGNFYDSGSGVKSGGLATILLVLLIIGFVLGAVGFQYYPEIKSRLSKAKRSATDSAGPTFVYSAHQEEP